MSFDRSTIARSTLISRAGYSGFGDPENKDLQDAIAAKTGSISTTAFVVGAIAVAALMLFRKGR